METLVKKSASKRCFVGNIVWSAVCFALSLGMLVATIAKATGKVGIAGGIVLTCFLLAAGAFFAYMAFDYRKTPQELVTLCDGKLTIHLSRGRKTVEADWNDVDAAYGVPLTFFGRMFADGYGVLTVALKSGKKYSVRWADKVYKTQREMENRLFARDFEKLKQEKRKQKNEQQGKK